MGRQWREEKTMGLMRHYTVTTNGQGAEKWWERRKICHWCKAMPRLKRMKTNRYAPSKLPNWKYLVTNRKKVVGKLWIPCVKKLKWQWNVQQLSTGVVAQLLVKSSVVLFSGRSVDSADSVELLHSGRLVGTKSHWKNFFYCLDSNLHIRGYVQSWWPLSHTDRSASQQV